MGNEERGAYLAGDDTVSLPADERAELDELGGLLADPASWAEPPAGLQEHIVSAITAERAAAEADSAETSPVISVSEPLPSTVLVADELSGRRRSRRILYTVLGVAAALVLAAGIAIGTTGHDSKPMQFAAALTGTELAPNASGTVNLTQTTSGWQIHLQATGLPRLDNGRYYEAWLKNGEGALVPVGTFNQANDVTLWAGVPPSSYPTFTVTRQQADGNPTSSKQVVLAGTTSRTH
ncbi:anti-sigma factor [Jatrophihabitans sp. DSM 45814]